jgi:hypothetical protein
MEPLAVTRERSNVYVKHYRELGGLIGDGMFIFVFVMYACSYEIDLNLCENSKSCASLDVEAPRGGTNGKSPTTFRISAHII